MVEIILDVATSSRPHVEFTRSMAALTADGVALKDWRLVPIYCVLDFVHLIAMAYQAADPNGPAGYETLSEPR